jgi:hypothetical protein
MTILSFLYLSRLDVSIRRPFGRITVLFFVLSVVTSCSSCLSIVCDFIACFMCTGELNEYARVAGCSSPDCVCSWRHGYKETVFVGYILVCLNRTGESKQSEVIHIEGVRM